MTNTSPYRFSSVRAIFLLSKEIFGKSDRAGFQGSGVVDQLCERPKIINVISKYPLT